MRTYLPIAFRELEDFIAQETMDAKQAFAPTQQFVAANDDCDDEEIEYLLSVAAGEAALELRASEHAPGIVLALEVEEASIGESFEDSITLTMPIVWTQVQCALLAFKGDDELVWFATQEIELHLNEWK